MSRRKGVTGEREAANLFERAGWTLRGYESGGDWLAVRADEYDHNDDAILVLGKTLHVEVKRAERLKLPEWIRQSEREAVPGSIPCVVWRQNQGDWYITMRLEDYLR
jgi:hypothetical protein